MNLAYLKIAQNIQDARKKAGLTQKALAEKIGVASITLQQYERAVREPRTETLEKIAHALEISPATLYGWQKDSEEGQEMDDIDISYMESRLYNELNPDAIEGFLGILLSLGYAVRYMDGNFQIRKSTWEKHKIMRDDTIFIVPDDEMKGLIEKQLSYTKFNISEVLEKAKCMPFPESRRECPTGAAVATVSAPEKKDIPAK